MKIKKTKKPSKDIVEINKSAFKTSRQIGKTNMCSEIIKKVVDNKKEIETIKEDSYKPNDGDNYSDDGDGGNDSYSEVSETELSDDSVISSTMEEDVVQIYRDVMVMNDDDRNVDVDGKLSPVRLTPPPPLSWYDNETNLKFRSGDFVRYKGNKNSFYKICGPGRDKDTYHIKASKARESFLVDGKKLLKVSEKEAIWIDYWKINPIIPAPKPWLKKENNTPKRK